MECFYIFYRLRRGSVSMKVDLTDWTGGEVVVMQAQTYLRIPWYAGGEHPAHELKPVKRLTILLRRAGQDAGRPVCVVVVFQQYFRWIPVCFIGKGTVASYHSVNQIWSCWVVPTWPSHVKVCMQQNVPYPWDTSLTSYGFDRRGHATTIDWLIRHPLLIAL